MSPGVLFGVESHFEVKTGEKWPPEVNKKKIKKLPISKLILNQLFGYTSVPISRHWTGAAPYEA